MARSSECTVWCAQEVLDSADIVRDTILQQLAGRRRTQCTPRHLWTGIT